MFQSLRYEPGRLSLLDQRKLPVQEHWVHCQTVEAVAQAIESMVIRGAPAIGCAAAFGLAVEATRQPDGPAWRDYLPQFRQHCERLASTRPTAISLFQALRRMEQTASGIQSPTPLAQAAQSLEATARQLLEEDVATCQALSKHGARLATEPVDVLTHCNTGSLATAGYGTALGVVRALHAQQKLGALFVDETRPLLQGSRLTAFELTHDTIPFQLVVDSAAGYLMAQGKVDWVLVGADRIAANGDVANKIGTYSLAVHADHHGCQFFVAAPLNTVDFETARGSEIPIEERGHKELTLIGETLVAPTAADTFNPAFDITPAGLISGIITERGVILPPFESQLARFQQT